MLLTIHHLPLTLPAHAQGITPQSIITTVAGNGRVFRGAGKPATSASLGVVVAVAVDPAGNVYAQDQFNNIVVKISPDGLLTVIAGNGIQGFSGEGGPATDASLNFTSGGDKQAGLALDASGRLYITDTYNERVRRVSPDGIISTVAGNGGFGFSGDGGLAISATFTRPRSPVFDNAGNFYVADQANNRIRKVSPVGIVTTVAGIGPSANPGAGGFSGDGGPATSAALNQPTGVAVDAAGNLYIADLYNQRIRKVSPDGIINTVAGNGTPGFSGDGGPATLASLNSPSGVALDTGGGLYIADGGNNRIRKVSPNGIITTVAGNGRGGFSGDGDLATRATLASPLAVAVDSSGGLYIADAWNARVRQVGPDGVIRTIAGTGFGNFSGDGGSGVFASLSEPRGMAADVVGNLYIADSFNFRIRMLQPDGTITTVAGNGVQAFSGDGGPAISASFGYPHDVALDGTGNLYIASDGRVRKVGPDGIIRTVAGGGGAVPGDGGPATAAALDPVSLALDAAGNVYIADPPRRRVRKVGLDGIITTVAGNGNAGSSGDGGLATNASLSSPSAVALDPAGNLYILDVAVQVVRKVAPSGTITTVAAGFDSVLRIATDALGNLYVADWFAAFVRKVSPNGIITTVAGVAYNPGFSGDGGPANQSRLNGPHGLAADVTGSIYIADSVNNRVRKILTTQPLFSVSPTRLNFTAQAGVPVIAAQGITVTSLVSGLGWNAQASTQAGGSWLTTSPSSGKMPGVADVRVDATNLTPGTYQGTVTILAPLAAAPMQTVAVTLTVNPAPAPKLIAEPLALTFEAQTGVTSLPAKTLRISNGGSGTVEWTARVETSSGPSAPLGTGGNWLEMSPSSGSVSAGSPIIAQVRALPGSLAAGVYTASIRLDSATTRQTETVPVTLLIAQPTKTILLSQTGLIFTGVEGGRAVPSQTFGIANIGEGEMVWALEATTLSGGANWLTVSPREGRSQANSLRVPLVEVSVNAAGLRAGQYNGLVRVNAFGAANSPQFTTVTLNVLPPGSNPGVVVRPSGMIFAAQAGTFSPGSQTVRLSTAASGQIEARSGLFTVNGGDWIEILPPNLVLSAEDPRTIVVQPKVEGLAAGVYRGQLAYAFSDGSPTQRVDILFLVVAGPVGTAGASLPDEVQVPRRYAPRDDSGGLDALGPLPYGRGSDGGEYDGLGPLAYARGSDSRGVDGCAPQRLHAVFRTLTDNFASPVGWPSPLEVQIADDCGGAVTNATVVASFSNGDRPLVLTSLRNGLYVGTWKPATVRDQVLVTVRVEQPPLPGIEVRAQGQVRDNPSAPSVSEGGVVNGASFAVGEPVAPGSIIAVFGRNLARGENRASRLPLETSLGGATLNIGGIEAPLFFSSEGQINAQVPFELTPNTRPHVVVRTTRADGAQVLTLPETITIATARPAIFTTSQQGTGQGIIQNQDYSLNSAANPAARGSVIVIYATGLGATNPPVPSGSPAPSSPLAVVTNAVTATIAGVNAAVQFAGLTPSFVGLYQVNVQIPAGVTPGSEVPLVLLQSGVPSNTVTLAVR